MTANQTHPRTATALAAVRTRHGRTAPWRHRRTTRRGRRRWPGDRRRILWPADLQRLQGLAQDAPVLVTTRRRAVAIGMEIPPHIAGGMGDTNTPITLDLPEGVPVDVILRPHERRRPTSAGRAALRPFVTASASHAPRIAQTAIELSKLARLLPAVVLGPLSRDHGNNRRDWAREQDLIYVDAADVLAYEDTALAQPAAGGAGPRAAPGAENARILAWRPSDGGKEHLAIVIGEIDPTEPVLTRLHSECFTGDLLGSLRCDCGDQLRGAITELAKQGAACCSIWPRKAAASAWSTSCAPTSCRMTASTRSTPTTAGLRCRRARLPAGRRDADAHGHQAGAADDQQSGEGRALERTASRSPSGCRIFPANDHNENYLRTKALRTGHLF